MTARRRTNAIAERAPVLAAAADVFYPVHSGGDRVTSIHLAWHDATTAGVFTVESTNNPNVALDSTDAAEWFAETLTITSPTGADAGCFIVRLGNNGALRARVRYNPSADSIISIWVNGQD